MSNDVDPQVVQNTQQILSKYIKKPALTEKLLKKPPFRFLHDVVTNVIRETGFLKGLYSERELVSENVKEKDDKLAYLNKLIDATKAITGTELGVRPNKIIAGLEPTETNLLLQAIGSALENKLDSSQYIHQLKSEKKLKLKPQVKIPESDRKTDKNKEKNVKVKTKHEEKTKIASTPISKNQKNRNVDTTKKSNKLKVDKSSTSKGSKDSVEVDTKLKTETKKAQQKTRTPRENVINDEQHIREVAKTNVGNQNENNSKANNEQQNQDVGNENSIIPHEQNDIADELVEPKINNQYTEAQAEKQELKDNGKQNKFQERSAYIEESVNILPIKEQAERIKSAKPKSSRSKKEKDPQIENHNDQLSLLINNDTSQLVVPDISKPINSPQAENNIEKLVRPRSSLRPPSVRPSSARPGAPRLRNEFALPEGEVIPLGKVNVIVESFNAKEIDEEETVTIQAAPEPEFQPPILQLPTDKGHLVEQILEQIHQDDVIEHTKSTVNIEWEQDGLRNRNAANKEIEQLKSAIQTLTRTANPLGKLVNYLHEDVEAMHSELDMWINSTRQIMVEVANHKRISDESNKPLQVQLEEIEDSITKHQQQIVSAFGNILRNEQRIRDLLIK